MSTSISFGSSGSAVVALSIPAQRARRTFSAVATPASDRAEMHKDVRIGAADPPADTARIGAVYFSITGAGSSGDCKIYLYTGSQWALWGVLDCDVINAPRAAAVPVTVRNWGPAALGLL
ncbi:hypothetical protein [Candidatus Poriferisodalis sp.]|uniref:hypothetical protein n=1 Tax=Candidatus Poriferisodalis sp. TaxID=3101277 RepID=UPI003B5AB881